MIVSLTEVKKHLRIEHSEDDTSLQMMINAAESFVKSATDSVIDETDDRIKVVCLFLIADMYEQRGFVTDKGSSKIRDIAKMMLLQI